MSYHITIVPTFGCKHMNNQLSWLANTSYIVHTLGVGHMNTCLSWLTYHSTGVSTLG